MKPEDKIPDECSTSDMNKQVPKLVLLHLRRLEHDETVYEMTYGLVLLTCSADPSLPFHEWLHTAHTRLQILEHPWTVLWLCNLTPDRSPREQKEKKGKVITQFLIDLDLL